MDQEGGEKDLPDGDRWEGDCRGILMRSGCREGDVSYLRERQEDAFDVLLSASSCIHSQARFGPRKSSILPQCARRLYSLLKPQTWL